MARVKGTVVRRTGDEAGAGETPNRRSALLRHRVAWMYYAEEMTQNAIAEALDIGRVTVVRLLAEAKALNEIRVSLRREFADLAKLESALERRFGIDRALVVPISSAQADPTQAIGAAVGELMGELIKPGMMLGVGWGRTLLHSLPFIDEIDAQGLTVVSLLGGISAVRQYNPAEFAWRFSRLFHADCYLIAAPALVDSKQTKTALVERCGIGPIFEMARKLDAVLLSVGSLSANSTAGLFDLFAPEDRRSLAAAGAVGNILFNFYGLDGRLVDHPLNERVMSVPLTQLQQVPLRVIASGGADKVPALLGGMRMLRPNIFVTDEITARSMLEKS